MREELGKKKKLLKKAIVLGSLVPIIAYAAFAVAVVGVTGDSTSPVATIRLGEVIGRKMVVFANLFSVFAMATSFLVMGLALKETYNYDYRVNKRLAWALTCALPLAGFPLGGLISSYRLLTSLAHSQEDA